MPDINLIHPAVREDKGKKWFYLDEEARALLPPDIVARLLDANHPAPSRRQAPADLEYRWTPTRHSAIRVIGSGVPSSGDTPRIPGTEVTCGEDGVPWVFADHPKLKNGKPDPRDLARLKEVRDAYAKEHPSE